MRGCCSGSFSISASTWAIAPLPLAFQPQPWRLLRLLWHFAATLATAPPPLAFPPQPWRLRRLLWHFRRNLGDCAASFGISAATLATAPPPLAFRRNLGDRPPSLGLSAPTFATAPPPLAFPPQPLRPPPLLWHFRRNVGDCGASFGISPQQSRPSSDSGPNHAGDQGCIPPRSCRSLARIVRTLAAQKAAFNRGQTRSLSCLLLYFPLRSSLY